MGTAPRGSRSSLELPLGAGLACVLALYLAGASAILMRRSAVEYGEPYIASASYLMGRGGGLYAPVEDLPFLHNNYNPLVQTLLAPLLLATGPAYIPFRALTVLSVLGLLLLCSRYVRRETGARLPALIFVALPLSGGFVFPWLAVGRVDAFALLCAGAALFAAHSVPPSASLPRLLVPALLCALGFAAKQTMLVVPGAVVLHWLLSRRLRDAAVFAGLAAAGGGLALLAAQLLSGGQYWLHAVVYNASHDRTPLWPEGIDLPGLLDAFGLPWLLVLLASLGAWDFKRHRLAILWFLLSLPWAFLLVRKDGSHVHYFFEPIVAGAVAGVPGLWRRIEGLQRGRRLAPAAAAAAVLAAAIPGLPWKPPAEWKSGAVYHARQVRHFATRELWSPETVMMVAERLAGSKKPALLLAQTASISVECGRAAIFDVADFIRLQRLGLWCAEDRLLPLVRAKEFPVIGVQEFEDPSQESRFGASAVAGLREAIDAHYRVYGRVLSAGGGRAATFYAPRP